jgi:hypothetical protein
MSSGAGADWGRWLNLLFFRKRLGDGTARPALPPGAGGERDHFLQS